MSASAQPRVLTRTLSMMRSLGHHLVIHPEQTYVASSLRGIGECRSTYVAPVRRELPESEQKKCMHAPLLFAAVAALGILSACATHHVRASMNDAAKSGISGASHIADCHNLAAPVSAGALSKTDNAACVGLVAALDHDSSLSMHADVVGAAVDAAESAPSI